MADQGAGATPIYQAPIRQRPAVFIVVVGAAVAIVVGLGVSDHGSFSGAFFTAGLITLAALTLAIACALALLLPRRIEVDADEIRLVAPRAVTRYDPAAMALMRQGPSEFAFVRRQTGRTLAHFRDAEPGRAARVFGDAGVEVQFGQDDH